MESYQRLLLGRSRLAGGEGLILPRPRNSADQHFSIFQHFGLCVRKRWLTIRLRGVLSQRYAKELNRFLEAISYQLSARTNG
jgi:hypothetical protein